MQHQRFFLVRLIERKETIKNFERSHFPNKYVLCSYYLQDVIIITCICMIICKSEYFCIDTGNSNDPGSCQTMYCFPYLIFEKIRLKRVKKKNHVTQHGHALQSLNLNLALLSPDLSHNHFSVYLHIGFTYICVYIYLLVIV